MLYYSFISLIGFELVELLDALFFLSLTLPFFRVVVVVACLAPSVLPISFFVFFFFQKKKTI
ncbi:uncharacterized protein J3D65DRAFT_631245, partial [Phyllosticta citribraziliensis]